MAEVCLGPGIDAEEEPLKRVLANILVFQENDGWWLEQQGPYPQGHYRCQRMGRFFPEKGEPSKWVTAKAMVVLKNALAG